MYKLTHDILHGHNIRYFGSIVGCTGWMVENTEQEYHGNRSDAAEGDQTETVARTVLVTSRGGETNTDGHNKRNGHRTCRHTAGVKCDCDEISRRRKGEQKQCGIEDTQQQGEAQLENDTQNSDDQKDTDAESDRPD